MARSVFFSFHFDRDFWRVQQVRNIGAIHEQEILSAQDWERVKRDGDDAVKRWIAAQMQAKSAAVVLVGAETASRKWVRHEIAHAWDNMIPLVGIRIHGLESQAGFIDAFGGNPFSQVNLENGRTVGDYVTLHDPIGANSRQVYSSIADNLESWTAGAYKRS